MPVFISPGNRCTLPLHAEWKMQACISENYRLHMAEGHMCVYISVIISGLLVSNLVVNTVYLVSEI